ncbi:MAG: DivIVA domain-containing protein, partial [Proteobacteria bacterium]|nr:DivIVA domain-containing protein [Pseudomonadota bacterium]
MDVQEIRGKEFARRFRGYDSHEVESFVGKLADYITDLHRELDGLNNRLNQTSQELKEYRHREDTLEANLAQTRRISEDMKANSEKEAKFIVAEAELQAERSSARPTTAWPKSTTTSPNSNASGPSSRSVC